MEVDHVPYIFGSFTRRRQSQHVTSAKSNLPSSNNTELQLNNNSTPLRPWHNYSRSQPVDDRTTAANAADSAARLQRARSCVVPGGQKTITSNGKTGNSPGQRSVGLRETDLRCPLCGRIFLEPRVLNCLHTFCTRCLQHVLDSATEEAEVWHRAESDVSLTVNSPSPESGGSGCESSTLVQGDVVLICPVCGVPTALGRRGVLGLPPHYTAQHRIFLATLHDESTRLLCDLCAADVTATHRCSECLVNLCDLCTDLHRRHKVASQHELLLLKDVRQKGTMRIHRQIMCQSHPEQELVAYCGTCSQVVCGDCVRAHHARHACEPAPRASLSRVGRVRHALQNARSFLTRDTALADRLRLVRGALEGKCTKLEHDVEKFIQAYREAIELHRTRLLEQVCQIREEKISLLNIRQHEVEKRIQEAQNTLHFTEELLVEGTDIELLTFVSTILKKLEHYNKNVDSAPKVSDSVHFLPNESVEYPDCQIPLRGVISAQTVAPNKCVLLKQGLENIRAHQKTELILETRDSSGTRIEHGGELVRCEVRYKEDLTSARSLLVRINDEHNGRYGISFTPDAPGQLTVAVTVRGRHIQGSPMRLSVQERSPNIGVHQGVFHCCSWCSSGGSKVTQLGAGKGCACGGTMPGGYLGCGHGHPGHPGRPHWSCCGSLLENDTQCLREISSPSPLSGSNYNTTSGNNRSSIGNSSDISNKSCVSANSNHSAATSSTFSNNSSVNSNPSEKVTNSESNSQNSVMSNVINITVGNIHSNPNTTVSNSVISNNSESSTDSGSKNFEYFTTKATCHITRSPINPSSDSSEKSVNKSEVSNKHTSTLSETSVISNDSEVDYKYTSSDSNAISNDSKKNVKTIQKNNESIISDAYPKNTQKNQVKLHDINNAEKYKVSSYEVSSYEEEKMRSENIRINVQNVTNSKMKNSLNKNNISTTVIQLSNNTSVKNTANVDSTESPSNVVSYVTTTSSTGSKIYHITL